MYLRLHPSTGFCIPVRFFCSCSCACGRGVFDVLQKFGFYVGYDEVWGFLLAFAWDYDSNGRENWVLYPDDDSRHSKELKSK